MNHPKVCSIRLDYHSVRFFCMDIMLRTGEYPKIYPIKFGSGYIYTQNTQNLENIDFPFDNLNQSQNSWLTLLAINN